MNEKQFAISIEGQGVDPTTIRLRELYEILHGIEAATNAVASQKGRFGEPIDFHLTAVHSGSATYLMTTTLEGYSAATACADAVARRDISELPDRAKEVFLGLRSKAKKTGWTFSMFHNGDIPAVISSSTEFIADSIISGQSTVAARIERVGGTSHRTATMILLDGRKITVPVATEALAKELGARLYMLVSLSGEAKWTTGDMSLIGFRITEIHDYQGDSKITETLQSLAEIAGDFWDEIDPDEYIGDLRSEAW